MTIGPLDDGDGDAAVALWHEAGLTRPWNDPAADLDRALAGPSSTVLAVRDDGRLVGTVMVGHDGHRGWIYYLAVATDRRRRGLGRTLMAEAEAWLASRVPKCQLMVRADNAAAAGFYEALGYERSDVVVLARWLDGQMTAVTSTEQDSVVRTWPAHRADPQPAGAVLDRVIASDNALAPEPYARPVTLDIHNVVVNCEDPQRLAGFWTRALEMDVVEDHGSFVLLGRPGSPVGLGLQRVPEPRVGRNRAHIDLHGEPREAAARRLVGLGATILGEERPPGLDLVWTVLTDPEGNEFCIGGDPD